MQTHNITLISTVHKEIGKCNSYELYKIIESIKPDAIFLEAFEKEYSKYDQMLFSNYGKYHKRLELKAIQEYMQNYSFDYVPVLDVKLSDEFDKKCKIVVENTDYQKILDNYISLETDFGFQFLNSKKQIALQDEMRALENRLIGDKTLLQKVNDSIDEYENSMLRNIYSICKQKSFNQAVFMCGAGHRKTITQKIMGFENTETIKVNWIIYNDPPLGIP